MTSHRGYPGNLVGSIASAIDSDAMIELLRPAVDSPEFETIGHFDGSVSVMFMFDGEVFRINLPMHGDAWSVHGHIDGDSARIRVVACKLAQVLFHIPLDFELSLFNRDAWEATSLYVRNDGGDVVEYGM